jgi:hypothetical protein
VATLEHFQYDNFIAHFSNKDLKADSYVTFSLNPDGTIEKVKLKIIDPDSLLSFSELLLTPVKEKNKS